MQGFAMPDIHLRTRVTTPSGIVLHDKREQGHSWTRNGWNAAYAMITDSPGFGEVGPGALYAMTLNTGVVNNSTTRSFMRNAPTWTTHGFYNDANSVLWGAQVGRSDEPFHLDDYQLYDLIAHGNNPGQFFYQGMTQPGVAYTDHKFTTTWSRVFNNNSGAAITVKEIGMGYRGNDNLSDYILMTRDVLETPVTVPNGAQLTVEVAFTSVSFETINDTYKSYLAITDPIGSAGCGGYLIGGDLNELLYGGNSLKYVLIVSPLSDAQKETYQWKTSNDAPPSSADMQNVWGKPNTDELLAIGAASPMGAMCADENAANLGGKNDWYIASGEEMSYLTQVNSQLPAAHQLSQSFYWSSSGGSHDGRGARVTLSTGAVSTAINRTTSYRTRLVRRILAADWVADV